MKLTKKQRARLEEIARNKPTAFSNDAPFWNGPTDKSLIRRGLIERCDQTRDFGGGVSFVTHLCRITPAGRAALSLEQGEKP